MVGSNHRLGGGGGGTGIAMDSPLKDISANMRDMRLKGSPSKGNSLKSALGSSSTATLGAGKIGLSRKDRMDTVPSTTTDLKTGITKDWRGPDKLHKTKVAASISRGDRYIPNRELKRPGSSHSSFDADGDTMRAQMSGDVTDPIIAANIAAANVNPTDLDGLPSFEDSVSSEMGQRILSFSAAPPTSTANPDVRSRYAAAKPKSTLPSSLQSAGRRRIPTTPESTLDAPDMVSDFYYNLLDWSSTNLVAVALGTGVWIWNGNTGDASALFDTSKQSEKVGGKGLVTGMRWDADGNILAVGLEGGYVQLWDIESETRLRTLKPTGDGGADHASVNVAAWAPDGTFTAGFQSGIIREYDVREKDAVTRTLEKAHLGTVCGMEWRSDSALMASGGNDNVVKVWDRRTSVAKMRKENHTGAVKALAWCPHSLSLLASGGGTSDRNIHFWNTTQNSRTMTIPTGAQITSLHWAPHYREIVSAHGLGTNESSKGVMNVWSHPTGTHVAEIEAHEKRVLHSSLSPDGEVLATVGDDEELKLWRIFARPTEPSKGAKPHSSFGSQLGDGSGVRTLR